MGQEHTDNSVKGIDKAVERGGWVGSGGGGGGGGVT